MLGRNEEAAVSESVLDNLACTSLLPLHVGALLLSVLVAWKFSIVRVFLLFDVQLFMKCVNYYCTDVEVQASYVQPKCRQQTQSLTNLPTVSFNCLLSSENLTLASLVLCCFQQVSEMISHLQSCLHLSNIFFRTLHSKHILYCCFINFFHTSLSMLLLHQAYHILCVAKLMLPKKIICLCLQMPCQNLQ